MLKAQMCLHSDSEAFVGQTYLIKKEKRGKVGRFVSCRKKMFSHMLQNEHTQELCSKSQTTSQIKLQVFRGRH